MRPVIPVFRILLLLFITACTDNAARQSGNSDLLLKRGELVSCGRESASFGTTSFVATIKPGLKQDFNMAVALLHSFEYDEAEKMFASVIDRAPDCAMAYWGVAMANFHPLWAPPGIGELEKGAAAVKLARAQVNKTARESYYINAVGQFYDDFQTKDHRTRVRKFESAMESVYRDYPDDVDAAVFYALSLNAAADPKDKTYIRQKKAFAILSPIFNKQPLHPGVAHLIIHSCDYPTLAAMGVDAARKYAAIAPASAHAQHMPSHIFTRLGNWKECVNSNKVAAASAVCYAEQAGINGHWDEELHALDYLMYAYLQEGDDVQAKAQLDYLLGMEKVSPANFKTAHAFAAIPARFVMEKKMWKEAATLALPSVNGPWDKYPWQEGIVHLARTMGLVHTGQTASAASEADTLAALYGKLDGKADKVNEAALVKVQWMTARAWLMFEGNDKTGALALMKETADLEDGMDKHPVTPGEVIPARELYADMLMEAGQAPKALTEYQAVLQTHANRFNALYGAASSARVSGSMAVAGQYFRQLDSIAAPGSARKELKEAAAFAGR